jgi:hypothetical protein
VAINFIKLQNLFFLNPEGSILFSPSGNSLKNLLDDEGAMGDTPGSSESRQGFAPGIQRIQVKQEHMLSSLSNIRHQIKRGRQAPPPAAVAQHPKILQMVIGIVDNRIEKNAPLPSPPPLGEGAR